MMYEAHLAVLLRRQAAGLADAGGGLSWITRIDVSSQIII